MVFARFKPLLQSARSFHPELKRTGYFLVIFATWIPAFIFFKDHVGHVGIINGPSMYPYFNMDWNRSLKQDKCWVNCRNAEKNVQRGMIISFWSPTHPEITAVKRVIALEGDTVYTRAPYPQTTCQVPAGHVWVEGDGLHGAGHRSLDSNYYGPISKSLIVGKVTHILWPWKSAGLIRWWEYRPKTRVVEARKMEEMPWV